MHVVKRSQKWGELRHDVVTLDVSNFHHDFAVYVRVIPISRVRRASFDLSC